MAYRVTQNIENNVEYQMQNREGQIHFPFPVTQLPIQEFWKTYGEHMAVRIITLTFLLQVSQKQMMVQNCLAVPSDTF